MTWWDATFPKRVKQTLPQCTADMTDFPVFTRLQDFPADAQEDIAADAGDLRAVASDDTTQLSLEVVDSGSLDELHVKTTLSSAAETDVWWYYGQEGASQPGAGDPFGSQDVWSNGYVGVWHMGQDPSGSAPQILDSTANGHHGTTAGTMTTADLVAGQIGDGLNFDGSNDSIDTGLLLSSFANGGSAGSVQWWMYPHRAHNSSVNDRPWGWHSGSGAIPELSFQHFGDNNIYAGFNRSGDDDRVKYAAAGGNWTQNQWQHFVLTWDAATTTEVLRNGVSIGTKATPTTAPLPSAALIIGRFDATVGPFDGLQDEFRVSETARSSTWLTTEYANQNDPANWYSFGSSESLETDVDRLDRPVTSEVTDACSYPVWSLGGSH